MNLKLLIAISEVMNVNFVIEYSLFEYNISKVKNIEYNPEIKTINVKIFIKNSSFTKKFICIIKKF